MYLVATNIVSEARRGTTQAVAWLRAARPTTGPSECGGLGEIMSGVALKQKSDPDAAAQLAEWLRHDHGDGILPVPDQIAVKWRL